MTNGAVPTKTSVIAAPWASVGECPLRDCQSKADEVLIVALAHALRLVQEHDLGGQAWDAVGRGSADIGRWQSHAESVAPRTCASVRFSRLVEGVLTHLGSDVVALGIGGWRREGAPLFLIEASGPWQSCRAFVAALASV